MKDLNHLVTADVLLEMSHDGVLRELIRGEVTEMAPAGERHGWTTGKLHALLGGFILLKKLGRFYSAETGFLIERNPDTVRAPDFAFVRTERVQDLAPGNFIPFAPDLVVEILSEHDRPGEVQEKIAQWLRSGASLVWLIDPDLQEVSVHRLGKKPRILKDADALTGEKVVPGFSIPVAELWD